MQGDWECGKVAVLFGLAKAKEMHESPIDPLVRKLVSKYTLKQNCLSELTQIDNDAHRIQEILNKNLSIRHAIHP